MPDEDTPAGESPGAYPLSIRAAALAGLFLVGALGYVLLDIIANGRLTKTGDCGCDGDAAAGDG
jgi:hypothetical protein